MTRRQDREKSRMITVPFSATPIKEPPDIRTLASIVVWTDRMLTTLLENKVRGGKWHSIYDKVWKPSNLRFSAEQVVEKRGAGGVDRQTVERFSERFQEEVGKLQQELKDESYRPLPVRRVEIPKPGSKETRPLGIPAVRDRVVRTALLNVIAPIFEHTFHERSYGFRRGRCTRNALQRVEELLTAGNVFVVDVDLKSYFDTIPKDKLLEVIKTKISDGALLRLISKYLDQSVMSELATWTPEDGVPQGAVLSPLLANAYLNPLGHLMAESGFEMVRYSIRSIHNWLLTGEPYAGKPPVRFGGGLGASKPPAYSINGSAHKHFVTGYYRNPKRERTSQSGSPLSWGDEMDMNSKNVKRNFLGKGGNLLREV